MKEPRYRFARMGQPLGTPRRIRAVMKLCRSVAKEHGGPYRFRRPGQAWGSTTTGRLRLYAKLRWHLPRAKEGQTVRFQVRARETVHEGGPKFRIRAMTVEVGPAEAEPNFPNYDINSVNERLRHLLRVAAGYDSGVRTNGLAYTRVIEGSSTYSQHSKWRNDSCLGNAADLVFPLPPPTGSDMGRLDSLRDELVDLAQEGEIAVHRLIERNEAYESEYGFMPMPYGGVYHYHIHLEPPPEQSGPVC